MPMPEPPSWLDEAEPASTVTLLYREFGDVLIPLEAVRLRYFRNRNGETFRRALRDGEIPLPVVTLDDSPKSPRFICLYQLAVLIEHRARQAAQQRPALSDDTRQFRRRLIEAIPTTTPACPV
jgi:hypothetical protein